MSTENDSNRSCSGATRSQEARSSRKTHSSPKAGGNPPRVMSRYWTQTPYWGGIRRLQFQIRIKQSSLGREGAEITGIFLSERPLHILYVDGVDGAPQGLVQEWLFLVYSGTGLEPAARGLSGHHGHRRSLCSVTHVIPAASYGLSSFGVVFRQSRW